MKKILLTGAFSLIVLGSISIEAANAAELVVIGGGLTGLMKAYKEKQEGNKVTIYEATSEVGGKAKDPANFTKSWTDYPEYMALAKGFGCLPQTADEKKRPTEEQMQCFIGGLTKGIAIKTGYKLVKKEGNVLTFETQGKQEVVTPQTVAVSIPASALERVEKR